MTFSLHQGGVVMSSLIMHGQLSNRHPLAEILVICVFIFISRTLFTVYPNHIM